MKPPRRTPRPFTVEVRRPGRQTTASSVEARPTWPEPLAEPQPPVEQPQEPAEGWFGAVVPTGRVLPALDQPRPEEPRPERKKRGRPRRTVPPLLMGEEPTEQSLEPEEVDEPEIVPLAALAPIDAPAEDVASAPRGTRLKFARLPRSAFPIGERWKARLPAVSLSDADFLRHGRPRKRRRNARSSV